MNRTLPEWAFLSDETGRYWYNLENGSRQPVEEGKGLRPPGRSLFAIATNDLVSIPQWVSSKDSTIINEVVEAEIAKLGIHRHAGPGKVSDWKPVELNGSRTLVQSVATPWILEELARTQGPGEFVEFFPLYALFPPPADAAVLWREGSNWVAGYSRGGHWVHVQTLGGDEMRPLLAGEINLTLIELSAKGLLEGAGRLVVWAPYDVELHQSLQSETGLPVAFENRPAPAPAKAPAWHFEPHEISRARLARQRRRRAVWFTVAGFFLLALLVAAAGVHLWQMTRANEALAVRIEAGRPDADRIQSAMDRWDTLAPAIDPVRFPIEIFHRISLLLPEEGLRLTTFEVRDTRVIEFRAESSTMAIALDFKGKVENDPTLSDYVWQIPPPKQKDDVIEIYATATYRFSIPNESE